MEAAREGGGPALCLMALKEPLVDPRGVLNEPPGLAPWNDPRKDPLFPRKEGGRLGVPTVAINKIIRPSLHQTVMYSMQCLCVSKMCLHTHANTFLLYCTLHLVSTV